MGVNIMEISAIIMASGVSKRMGKTNKLFLKYHGKTFIERVCETVLQVGFKEVILVISPENLSYFTPDERLTIVENREYHLGQSASVRLGTQVASGEGYIYFPVDQPKLTKLVIQEIIVSATKHNIIAPIGPNGYPTSPVFFGSDFFDELICVQGQNGGKTVKAAHKEACVCVSVTQPECLIDIDNPSDFQKLIEMD